MNRLEAEKRGRRGEVIAAWFLRLQGWRIVAERVKTPRGEVDQLHDAARRSPLSRSRCAVKPLTLPQQSTPTGSAALLRPQKFFYPNLARAPKTCRSM